MDIEKSVHDTSENGESSQPPIKKRTRSSNALVQSKQLRRSGRKSNQINYNETKLMTNAFKENKPVIKNEKENENEIVEKICGATAVTGKLQFIFKWKDQALPTLVSSEEAKIKYPNAVMEFYESQIILDSSDSESEEYESSN